MVGNKNAIVTNRLVSVKTFIYVSLCAVEKKTVIGSYIILRQTLLLLAA